MSKYEKELFVLQREKVMQREEIIMREKQLAKQHEMELREQQEEIIMREKQNTTRQQELFAKELRKKEEEIATREMKMREQQEKIAEQGNGVVDRVLEQVWTKQQEMQNQMMEKIVQMLANQTQGSTPSEASPSSTNKSLPRSQQKSAFVPSPLVPREEVQLGRDKYQTKNVMWNVGEEGAYHFFGNKNMNKIIIESIVDLQQPRYNVTDETIGDDSPFWRPSGSRSSAT